MGLSKSDKSKRYFHLHHTLTFGKYKGAGIEETIINDPSYMKWVLDNVEWFALDSKAEAFLNEQLDITIDNALGLHDKGIY